MKKLELREYPGWHEGEPMRFHRSEKAALLIGSHGGKGVNRYWAALDSPAAPPVSISSLKCLPQRVIVNPDHPHRLRSICRDPRSITRDYSLLCSPAAHARRMLSLIRVKQINAGSSKATAVGSSTGCGPVPGSMGPRYTSPDPLRSDSHPAST
jgi:hypothetical protein